MLPNGPLWPQTSQTIDQALAALAARQHGNVTRRQLLALGLKADAISYRVEIGRLHRLHRGVYAVGKRAVTPLERAAAAVLACGPGALLSHASAMALWGFSKRWDEPFEVTIAGQRRPGAVTVHRSQALARRDATRQLGIAVTSPARTLLDCTPRLSEKALTRVVNDALHSRYLHLSALAELLDRCGHHKGAGRLAPFVGTRHGPTRSELEDEFIAFCTRYGLPQPAINVKVGGYEVDAFYEAEQMIVELDGWEYHSSREAFELDRERDADAIAGGIPTLRITWERMRQAPRKEAARLHAILASRRARAG